MTSIWIDYNRYLDADEISVPLRDSQLRQLHEGDVVTIEGDAGIPERKATIVSIDGRNVRLRFDRPLSTSA
jgi:hypothetical protein